METAEQGTRMPKRSDDELRDSYSQQAAADELGISAQTIRNMRRRGELPAKYNQTTQAWEIDLSTLSPERVAAIRQHGRRIHGDGPRWRRTGGGSPGKAVESKQLQRENSRLRDQLEQANQTIARLSQALARK